MTLPQIVVDLIKLLFDTAVPAAMCTMVLAGVALRQEGGVNFQTGGKFQRWTLWSVILLTLPQFLSWFAAQGISMPPQGRKYQQSVGRERRDEPYWVCLKRDRGQASSDSRRFLRLKAALDAAEGHSPLASIVAGTFLL